MSKLICLEGDVKPFLDGKKSALLCFGQGRGLFLQPKKAFGEKEGKKGYEQLKRYVSSEAFQVIVLDGFASALEEECLDEVAIWLKDHSALPSFPVLLFLGGGCERLKGLVFDKA